MIWTLQSSAHVVLYPQHMIRQACDMTSIKSSPVSLLAFDCLAFPFRFFSDRASTGTAPEELGRRFLAVENLVNASVATDCADTWSDEAPAVVTDSELLLPTTDRDTMGRTGMTTLRSEAPMTLIL
jgi:hypothetical protein